MAIANIFDLLASVPEFNGKPEELNIFVQHIDEVRRYAEEAQTKLFDLRIRTKIVGRANIAMINNNSPMNWEEMKIILKANFNISESIESIVNKIKTAECRENISNFYEYILQLLTKLNLKNSIDVNEEWYSCQNNEKMVLKIFIAKLPSEPKLVLNARNPSSLLEAKGILIETEYFFRNFSNNKPNFQPISSNANSSKFNNGNGNNQNYFSSSKNQKLSNAQSRNSNEQNYNFSGNRNFVNTRSGNFNDSDVRHNYVGGNRNDSYQNPANGSNQSYNNNGPIPMEVDSIQASNFHSVADELFPV